MGELEDARAEAGVLREALATAKADADARVDALRKQQTEAKAKAKAIILRQKADANQKVQLLSKEKERQMEELNMVKNMLREEVEAKRKLIARVEELDVLVDTGKSDLERVVAGKSAAEGRVRKLENELREARESGTKQVEELQTRSSGLAKELQKRVAELEEILKAEREKNATDQGEEPAVSRNFDVDEKLDAAKEQILQLETAYERLRGENENLLQEVNAAKVSDVADPKSPDDSQTEHPDRPQEVSDCIQVKKVEFEEQKSEMERLQKVMTVLETEKSLAADSPSPNEQIADLSKQLDSAREELKSAEGRNVTVIEELRKQMKETEEKLATTEESARKFKLDLEKSEVALQEERENVIREKQKASERSAGSDNGKKILEAKVAELERVIASKQADIVKVRDKARTYLKDINAEKREIEDRMKREVEALRSELVEDQQKALQAEQRAESVSSELDNCLALIREKQKSLQMLKMSISTERKTAEEAQRKTDALRAEFAAYKERARIALQEKETVAGASEAAIEEATASLRVEVETMRRDNTVLRKQISSLRQNESKMREVLERAEKAEAAVDLLRKDATGVSAANYSQVDVLEEKIAALESGLTNARASAEDAEARQETTMMRLEAAERALRGAEVRAKEAARLANKTIEGLKKQIQSLESALERSEQTSAAAQRTAAVAAKALAYPAAEETEVAISPQRSTDQSAQHKDSMSGEISPYRSSASLNAGRSSFAAAMAGQAGRMGLGGRSDGLFMDRNGEVSHAELESRDKQITVLTTQVAELGALLDETQQEANLKSEQTALLKAEVKNLDAKLAAAEKLQNGAPFSYLRTIVVRYLETDDPTLLPVVANVLSFTKEEEARVKARKGSAASASTLSTNSQQSGYFSLPFLGSR